MLTLLLACRPDPQMLLVVEVPDEQPLALDVQWDAVDTDGLLLERTLSDGTVLEHAVDPAGGHVRAFGHPALSVVDVALVSAEGERSETVSVTVGNLTPEVPTFMLEGSVVAPGELLVICTFLIPTEEPEDVLVVLDHNGQVVWSHAEPDPVIYRPDLLLTETGWWGLRQASRTEGDTANNTLTRYDWSGTVREEIAAPESHHVFTQTPDGLAWVVQEVLETKKGPWFSDQLLVDGTPLMSMGDLGAEALVASAEGFMNRQLSHTNGLHYDAEQERFLMTLGAQAAVLEVDAVTGEALRWLGSPLPEGLALEAAGWTVDEGMVLPHMAHWTDTGTLLLTGSDADFRETWATEFAVEGDALVPVWSHGRGEGLGAFAMGHATRLDDGDTLINYGTAGAIQRVSVDGVVEGQITAELGRIIGRSMVIDPLPLLDR